MMSPEQHLARIGAVVERIEDVVNGPLLISSAEFANVTPPDFLIEGLLQRRFMYSLTAATGTGKTAVSQFIAKTVSLGGRLAGREVEQGKVLFLAVENPDDARMRWVKFLADDALNASDVPVFWTAGSLKLSSDALRKQIERETATHGPFALVVVDTSVAFFSGDDENANMQMAAHARTLRSYIESVSGGPTILVNCHPVKNAGPDNLIPRGGGAFLAEVDGNLTLQKKADTRLVEMHWQGKFRGPEFAPIPFALLPGTAPGLVDSKGRTITTVTARAVGMDDIDEADAAARHRQDRMMAAVQRNPSGSITDLAREVGWFYATGEPNKSLANRTLKSMEALRLIKRNGNLWAITRSGKAALKQAETDETIEGENE